MSAVVSGQMTFGWTETPILTPVVVAKASAISLPSRRNVVAKRSVATIIPLTKSRLASSPVRAKPMAELEEVQLSTNKVKRRNQTEHISDLMLVVLEKYGINPEEFLAGLNN